MADFLLDCLEMDKPVPCDMYDQDSKLELRKIVLMFKSAIDRQEYLTTPLQALHQDVVGKASPSQFQDGENLMVRLQKMSNARVYAFIEDDPHGLPRGERFDQTLLGQGEKAGRLLALHTGEIGEKGVERVAFRDVVEKGLNRHTGAGKARGAMHDVRVHPDDFIEAQFLCDAHFFIRIRRSGSSPQALWWDSAPGNEDQSHGGVEVHRRREGARCQVPGVRKNDKC